jgi:hypothetical protein
LTDDTRQRSLDLFNYLREFARLRSRPVRDVEQSEALIWFSDVPRERECFTQLWEAGRDHREDIWLEIRKVRLAAFPLLPPDLQPWVRESDHPVDECAFREPQRQRSHATTSSLRIQSFRSAGTPAPRHGRG